MSLPYPSMTFSPFAILTAEEMNELVANDQALAAGTGLDSNAVTTAKIADGAVTAVKRDESTTQYWTGWTTGNFGTTQTSLGTKAITIPAGCNYVEITGAIRLQSQDTNQKDIQVWLSNNQNASLTHTVFFTALSGQTFSSATCALVDQIPVTPGSTVTFDMRAVTSSGAANSSSAKIKFRPIKA